MLSRRVSVSLLRDSRTPPRIHSLTVTKSSSPGGPTVMQADVLHQYCSSGSKWALENPGRPCPAKWCHTDRAVMCPCGTGIILAACLQEVWGVLFTEALGNSSTGLKANGCGSGVESNLFNVYGPVRLVGRGALCGCDDDPASHLCIPFYSHYLSLHSLSVRSLMIWTPGTLT